MTDKGENIFDPWLGPKRTNPVKTWDMPEDYIRPGPTVEEVGQNPTIPPDGPNLTIEEVGPNPTIPPDDT
jgi:hypothetical protein